MCSCMSVKTGEGFVGHDQGSRLGADELPDERLELIVLLVPGFIDGEGGRSHHDRQESLQQSV